MSSIGEAEVLRLKYKRDLQELQDRCLHQEWSEMPYSYGPGHFGDMVRVCNNCEKILEPESEKNKWE